MKRLLQSPKTPQPFNQIQYSADPEASQPLSTATPEKHPPQIEDTALAGVDAVTGANRLTKQLQASTISCPTSLSLEMVAPGRLQAAKMQLVQLQQAVTRYILQPTLPLPEELINQLQAMTQVMNGFAQAFGSDTILDVL